jgi:dihydropteroate synthase
MPGNPTDNSRYRLNCTGTILDLSAKPAIMGIINLTPDSFFDGGTFSSQANETNLEFALESALAMVRAGAEIIDVGGESTRPGAKAIGATEEIERTIPFIKLLRRNSDVLISIDTWKSEVAAEALRAGANIVNDISGLTFDPALAEVCGRYRCGMVLMHTPSRPQSLRWSQETGADAEEVMSRVTTHLRRSIESARNHGIEAIVIDPGLGFGKTVEENFRLLERLDELHDLCCPVLAGLSRKSFLGQAIRKPGEELPSPSQRLTATISANTIALMHGADILRVHDVEAAVETRAVVIAMRGAR